MKFKAKTNNERKLNINWDLVNQYVSRWKPNTYLFLEITRRETKRSDPLRKYYFGVVLKKYGNHLGYDRDEEDLLHRQLKIVFFKVEPDNKGIYRKVPSVFGNESDEPVSVKAKFVEWVKRCAAKDSCYIPDPNE